MLYHTLNALQLPGDMLWSDEFNWNTIERATEYSLSGALIVDVGQRLAGRPITLEGADNGGWMPRSALLALYDMAATPVLAMVLTLTDLRMFTVTFAEGNPIEAEPVIDYSDPQGDTWYVVKIRLMEI